MLRRHNIVLTRRELRERTETIMKSQQAPLDASPLSNDFRGQTQRASKTD
jgi:hypothetical protein